MTFHPHTARETIGALVLMLVLASCGGASDDALATPDEAANASGPATTRGPASRSRTTTRATTPEGDRALPGGRKVDGSTTGQPNPTSGGGTTTGGGTPTGGGATTGGPGPDAGGPTGPGPVAGGSGPDSAGGGSTAAAGSGSPLRRRDVPPEGINTQFDFLDPSGPGYVVVVAPDRGRAGTTFHVTVPYAAGPDDESVVLDLYEVTRHKETDGADRKVWSYLTELGTVSSGPRNPALQLVTEAGDPPGTYCVAPRVENAACKELVVT